MPMPNPREVMLRGRAFIIGAAAAFGGDEDGSFSSWSGAGLLGSSMREVVLDGRGL